MAQLKDDCFAFDGRLISLDAALEKLASRIEPVANIVRLPLREALGHVLAKDIVASRDVPPHHNSAVDGFAVNFDDLSPGDESRLPISGRVAAGHPLDKKVLPGEAVQIFTGAQMPPGVDTVYMEEDCTTHNGYVILPAGLKRGANLRLRGEDVSNGETILIAGKRLRPQELGLVASIGQAEVSAFAPIRAAVFSSGDEVCDPSGDAPDGFIYDANRVAVIAMLQNMGCTVSDLGILPDDEDSITAALCAAEVNHDVLITSGGVSAGEEDHIKAAVERLGEIHFWRLSIKPGRPIALGRVGSAAFVGLPGNPVAAMVTFMVIARPVLQRLGGFQTMQDFRYPVTVGFNYEKKIGRREWIRVKLEHTFEGLTAQKYLSGGSGVLSSMTFADGLVELNESLSSVKKGDTVEFLPFNEVTR
ncbi:MAG: molybdopterin molybdenumtransferase MoeA [Rhodospirillaceae bacterium TMED8]|nr:molybdopterin molybdenumtransferase MoeA [Magnetovibrio sp.]OUT47729.1 MAG: molybdopterin molybdenumtransferase MoeA [Rhodospirillaceae bacterium TMED8]